MWKKNKTTYDYGLNWDEWHERDLIDFMKRDRNHPSVIMGSIGNEILEQWDTSGIQMLKDQSKQNRHPEFIWLRRAEGSGSV